ncbi:MAG: hypothetical protein WA948_00245 [Pontixanthobacter sp.]
MSDIEDKTSPLSKRQDDGLTFEYDFYKSMCSFSLLTLGGVLTLTGTFAAEIAEWQLILISVLLAIAGIIAFQCLTETVQIANGSRANGAWMKHGLKMSSLSFAAGVGIAISAIIGALT